MYSYFFCYVSFRGAKVQRKDDTERVDDIKFYKNSSTISIIACVSNPLDKA